MAGGVLFVADLSLMLCRKMPRAAPHLDTVALIDLDLNPHSQLDIGERYTKEPYGGITVI